MFVPKWWAAAAVLGLACTVGFGAPQAANIVASEDGDFATLVGTQFDVTPFTPLAPASRGPETARS